MMMEIMVTTITGLYTPFVYIYEKAVSEVRVPKGKASLILSVLGVSNTLGRLAAGLVADRPWADAVFIHNISAVAAGLLTCLVSVFFTFELLCLYAALFGVFLGEPVISYAGDGDIILSILLNAAMLEVSYVCSAAS